MRADIVRKIKKRLIHYRGLALKAEPMSLEDFALKCKMSFSGMKALVSLKTSPDKFNPELDTLNDYLAACGRTLGDLFAFSASSLDDDIRQLSIQAKTDPAIKVMLDPILKYAREALDREK